jgi:hypothetical protein
VTWTTQVFADFVPSQAGWNSIYWPDAGAHRWLNTGISNAPGVGPTINEVQLLKQSTTRTLYSSALIEGTANGYGDGCGSATHNGYVSNNFNSDSNPTMHSGGVNIWTYISVPNNDSFTCDELTTCVSPQPTISISTGVNCSAVGLIFAGLQFAGGIWFQSELATAMWKNDSPRTQSPPWSFSSYCSARTTPPDLASYGIIANGTGTWQPAVTASNDCERFGSAGIASSPWLCFAVVAETLPVLPTTKPDCSNWDNGYPGRIIKNVGNGPQPMVPPKP